MNNVQKRDIIENSHNLYFLCNEIILAWASLGDIHNIGVSFNVYLQAIWDHS